MYLIKYRKELHKIMKKFLTVKNILVCAGVLFGLLVFIFSFLAAFRVQAGTNWVEYKGIIWGSAKAVDNQGNTANFDPKVGALALPLIGAILALVAGLCACVFGFFGEKLVKDAKVRKIIMLVCGGLLVLGGIFSFIYLDAFKAALVKQAGVNNFSYIELEWKAAVGATSYTTSCALPIISGILAILGGGAVCASEFVK